MRRHQARKLIAEDKAYRVQADKTLCDVRAFDRGVYAYVETLADTEAIRRAAERLREMGFVNPWDWE